MCNENQVSESKDTKARKTSYNRRDPNVGEIGSPHPSVMLPLVWIDQQASKMEAALVHRPHTPRGALNRHHGYQRLHVNSAAMEAESRALQSSLSQLREHKDPKGEHGW